MRKLIKDKRKAILATLVEGMGINATARVAGVSKLTVLRLLADVGSLCRDYHDVEVQNLTCERIQVDEIWSFCGCKQRSKEAGKQGDGDVWVWIGIDADTKLVVSYLVGGRDASFAHAFMHDIADRVTNRRFQLTSDGHNSYLQAVESAFGMNIDFGQLIKQYGPESNTKGPERKYSPGKCNGAKKVVQFGLPDKEHISTSFIERQNLTLRMMQRRFTRLTNAFSKRIINHEHAVSLHYFFYNFIRRHKTIGTTPAVAAGVTDREWKLSDLVDLLENEERIVANGGRINREDRT